MYIKVKVNPKSKKISIHQKSDDKFEIFVKSKPENNTANEEMIEILSAFLGISKKRLRIIKGGKARSKIIEII